VATSKHYLRPHLHSTVKPIALVVAIKDCSRRVGLVLDPCCGSGTVLIAASGLVARHERRPLAAYAGKPAVLAPSGATFETIAEQRVAKPAAA
jgi:hypothetical protein